MKKIFLIVACITWVNIFAMHRQYISQMCSVKAATFDKFIKERIENNADLNEIFKEPEIGFFYLKPCTSLIVAATNIRNCKDLKTLLTKGANPNIFVEYNKDKITPLKVAVLCGNIQAVKILLENNANPNLGDKSIISYAVSVADEIDNFFEICDLLLSAGAKIDLRDNNSKSPTPLFDAIERANQWNLRQEKEGQEEHKAWGKQLYSFYKSVIEYLIYKGADPYLEINYKKEVFFNSKDTLIVTNPLRFSIKEKLTDVVNILTKSTKQSKIEQEEKFHFEPLDLVPMNALSPRFLEFLLKKGGKADQKYKFFSDNESVLKTAVRHRKFSSLRKLFEYNKNLNKNDLSEILVDTIECVDRITCATYQICHILLEKGAEPNYKDFHKSKRTLDYIMPLSIAVSKVYKEKSEIENLNEKQKQYSEIIENLKKKNLSNSEKEIKELNETKDSCAYLAARSKKAYNELKNIIRLLLKYGADPQQEIVSYDSFWNWEKEYRFVTIYEKAKELKLDDVVQIFDKHQKKIVSLKSSLESYEGIENLLYR